MRGERKEGSYIVDVWMRGEGLKIICYHVLTTYIKKSGKTIAPVICISLKTTRNRKSLCARLGCR
jgi:hypothetical protein